MLDDRERPRSIDYIEDNLRSPIGLQRIAAQAANDSQYHFVRLFRALTGETPGSYLRKRRLSGAAVELVESNRSLVELAAQFQFQSHAAAYGEWLPHSGRQPAEPFDLEDYDARFTGPDRADSILEIWIPVD